MDARGFIATPGATVEKGKIANMGRPNKPDVRKRVPISEQGYKKCLMQLRNAAKYQNLKFEDLFRKSDKWLLAQPYIGIKCVYVLREMQGEEK